MGTELAQNSNFAELAADVREQMLYMQELGVGAVDIEVPFGLDFKSQISDLRSGAENFGAIGGSIAAASLPPAYVGGSDRSLAPANAGSTSRIPPPVDTDRKPGSRLASLPSLLSRKTMPFFDKYNPEQRQVTGDRGQDVAKAPVIFDIAPALPEPTETIALIRADIGADCSRCKLSQCGRKQVVNSVGNFDAELMFVGEAPGADEDIQGEPFVGRAGQLLTDIIEKGLQIPRSSVFIGNINRCRPPGNRTPEPDEAAVCKPFLLREIAVVRPRVIVVLGAHAAHNLLETKTPISKLRGNFHDYVGVKVMPTFHPSYLLRDPHKKREVWEDMKMVRDYLNS